MTERILGSLNPNQLIYGEDDNDNGVYDSGERWVTVSLRDGSKAGRHETTEFEMQRVLGNFGIHQIHPGAQYSDLEEIRNGFLNARQALIDNNPSYAESIVHDLIDRSAAGELENIEFSLDYFQNITPNLTEQAIDYYCESARIYAASGSPSVLRNDGLIYEWVAAQRPSLVPKLNRYMTFARNHFFENYLNDARRHSRTHDLRRVSGDLFQVFSELESTRSALPSRMRSRILSIEAETWRNALHTQLPAIERHSEHYPLEAFYQIQVLRQELLCMGIPFNADALKNRELSYFHRAVEALFTDSKEGHPDLHRIISNILIIQSLESSSGLRLNPSESSQLRAIQQGILPQALQEVRDYASRNSDFSSRALRAISSLRISNPLLAREYPILERQVITAIAISAHQSYAANDRVFVDYSVRMAARLLHLERGDAMPSQLAAIWKEETGMEFAESQRQSIPGRPGVWHLSHLIDAPGFDRRFEISEIFHRYHYLNVRDRALP